MPLAIQPERLFSAVFWTATHRADKAQIGARSYTPYVAWTAERAAGFYVHRSKAAAPLFTRPVVAYRRYNRNLATHNISPSALNSLIPATVIIRTKQEHHGSGASEGRDHRSGSGGADMLCSAGHQELLECLIQSTPTLQMRVIAFVL